jgi:hypothetical protein
LLPVIVPSPNSSIELAADGWGWQRVGWLIDKEQADLEEGQQGWTSRAFRSKQREGYGGERWIRYSRNEDMQEDERDIKLQKFLTGWYR